MHGVVAGQSPRERVRSIFVRRGIALALSDRFMHHRVDESPRPSHPLRFRALRGFTRDRRAAPIAPAAGHHALHGDRPLQSAGQTRLPRQGR